MSLEINRSDAEWLDLYLKETLDAQGMAYVEKRLRHEPELLEQLNAMRITQTDPAVHSVAMAWMAGRLTCASRAEWTQYFSGLLDANRSEYMKFHLEFIECPFCCANVADLQKRHTRAGKASEIASRSARAAGWSDHSEKH